MISSSPILRILGKSSPLQIVPEAYWEGFRAGRISISGLLSSRLPQLCVNNKRWIKKETRSPYTPEEGMMFVLYQGLCRLLRQWLLWYWQIIIYVLSLIVRIY